jgi:hypothetical protein
VIRFLPEWEWGWKTPLLLDPLAFAQASEPSDLALLPPLLEDILDPTLLNRISLNDADATLTEALDRLKTSRVGLRFERVQETLFRAHPHTLELRASVPVGQRTEIDLLQRVETDFLLHWEVAVKFYLALDPGGSTDPMRWVGPSLRDALGRKLRTIREKQLGALLTPEDRFSIGLATRDRVVALPKVHGVLFLPLDSPNDPAPALRNPEGVSPQGLRGTWMKSSDVAEYFSALEEGARIRALIDRKEWIRDQRLVDGTPSEIPSRDLARQIAEAIESSATPAHFAVVFGRVRPEFRFFVVPNAWPAQAEAALDSFASPGRIKT